MNENLIGKRVIEKDVEFPRKGKVVFETDLNVNIRFYMGGSLETTKEDFKDFFEILTGFDALAPGDVVINSKGEEYSCIQVAGDLYWVRNLNGYVINYPFSIQYDKTKGFKIKGQEKEEKQKKYSVNDRFVHTKSNEEFTIKGAWSGKTPENSHCFLMKTNGVGHVYVGHVTKVKDVWNITEDEFLDMCGNRPEWLKK